MKVVEGGETGCLPGTNINVNAFTELNKQVLKNGKHPAVARPVLLGLQKHLLKLNHSYLQHHSKKLLRS